MLTAKRLGEILQEEFASDSFGDIDPYWFTMPELEAGEVTDDTHEIWEHIAVKEVLERVGARLKEES